ncbi:MAG: D-alanyl-D-alanine carboxypeptidase family protein [Eubacteriales bacterium]|nr:D-alanyl-D-alanine carboxypeptidase family protein [Eubacteriales bacterium]
MRKTKRPITALLTAVLLLLVSVPVQAVTVNNGTIEEAVSNSIEGWPAALDTFSETAVVIDADTGAVLYDKGKDSVRYPASITKLMTLLLAVENCALDEEVTFTETGVRDVTADSTNIGMQLGEVMSMESCLYALVIQSANEVAAQIAEYVGGTEAEFVNMMNRRAKELGCQNTNFVNASGLPDENHYTTAYDMAKIMRAGLKNKTFRKIIQTQTYVIPATNMSEERRLHTHLPLLAEESPLYYEGCIGGKTGVTSVALNTLVVGAERDGETYIVVTMRDAELSQNCSDSTALLDYAFQNFEHLDVNGLGTLTVPVGTSLDALETKEAEKNGVKLLQYYFGGQYVGVSRVETPEPESSGEVEEAEDADQLPLYQEDGGSDEQQEPVREEKGLSDLTKFLFTVMGFMALILLVLVVALVMKNRKRKHKVK